MRMKSAAILLLFLFFCITWGTTEDTVSGYKTKVHNGKIAEIIKPGFSGGGGGGHGGGGGFSGGGGGGSSSSGSGGRGGSSGIGTGGRSGGVTGTRSGSGPGGIIHGVHGSGYDGGHGRNGGAAKDPVTSVLITIAAAMMLCITMILA